MIRNGRPTLGKYFPFTALKDESNDTKLNTTREL